MRTAVTLLIYVLSNLGIAVLWHLVLFKDLLAAATPFARPEPLIPLGMAAMLVQGLLLIWIYPRFHRPLARVRSGLGFGAMAGLFLATGAIWVEVGKFQFADSLIYLGLETVYEIGSFAVLGLIVALRHQGGSNPE